MPEAFSVSELNEFLKIAFDQSEILRDIYVKGEISNFTNHYKTGHYYFTIKDENSALKAVMFRMYTNMIDFVPENGMKIIAHGKVDIFVRDGYYSLKVDNIIPDGVGALYISYEQLKNKLEKEGLFSDENKNPIPPFPQKIGVLTSETGAVIQDIRNVSARRFPLCEIVLYPCSVQGTGAVSQLINGLDYFEESDVDTVIIARGGGSLEDLMPFNDEKLARRIFQCQKPVISAVGHETDYTICDFVSDLRAPTPSAAAELALPSSARIFSTLESYKKSLDYKIRILLESKSKAVENISNNPVFSKPFASLELTEAKLDALLEKLNAKFEGIISSKKSLLDGIRLDEKTDSIIKAKEYKISAISAKMQALSPLSVLSRGYSVVFKDGTVVNDIAKLQQKDIINIRMKNGNITAEVKKIEQD